MFRLGFRLRARVETIEKVLHDDLPGARHEIIEYVK